jgi:hypothetical protein
MFKVDSFWEQNYIAIPKMVYRGVQSLYHDLIGCRPSQIHMIINFLQVAAGGQPIVP